MTLRLEKPIQVSAVVTPCNPNSIVVLPQLDAAPISLAAEDKPTTGKRMPFSYCPGPISIILLKIKAIENYSANTDRLNRQRLFCSRVKGA